jgi:hypothetical protein
MEFGEPGLRPLKEEAEFAPLCIWCGAPWSEKNVELDYSSGTCDTCSIGSGAKVSITCHKCKKVMYEKQTWSYEGSL